MKKNLLFIPELENVLHTWEDANLMAGTLFELSMNEKVVLNSAYHKPLVGSELDKDYNLRNSIKNYSELRKHIERKEDFDETQFFPRIPKKMRETYTSQMNFLRSSKRRPIAMLPYFLSRWLKYKKVYALYGEGSILMIDTDEKNYLSLAPFDSFIIKFDKPFYMTYGDIKTEDCSLMIICLNREDEIMDVIFIPTNIETYQLDKITRQIYSKKKDLKQIVKSKFFKDNLDFMGISIDLQSGNIIDSLIREPGMDEFEQAVYVFSKDKGNEALRNLNYDIVKNINGFCKTISELEPQKVSTEFVDVVKEPSIQKSEEYDWNCIPITQIKNLKKLGYQIHISSGIGQGTEKSPHWRRGHWRTIEQKEGVKRRTWVSEVLIRKDKLKTEGLVGSVTIVKDEES